MLPLSSILSLNSLSADHYLIESNLDSFLASNKASSIYIAFSGGMDSSVLLSALVKAKKKLNLTTNLTAIYVDHGLQEESAEWARFCQSIAVELGVEFVALKLNIESTQRKGLEAVARQKRYQALVEYIVVSEQFNAGYDDQGAPVLLTGHHQRDQAETLLLNLCRGSGLYGLASMPKNKSLVSKLGFKVTHCRPLLDVSYKVMQSYAECKQLAYVEDNTNEDNQYRRNLIRNHILPEIEQAWPNAQQQIANAAEHLQEASSLLELLAQKGMNEVEYSWLFLTLQEVGDCSWVEQKNRIRYWMKINFPLVVLSAIHYQWILSVLEQKAMSENSKFCYKLKEGELKVFKSRLYFLPKSVLERSSMYRFEFESIDEFDCFLSGYECIDECGFNQAFRFKINRVQGFSKIIVRSISSSDDVKRKALKKFYQNNEIPAWERLVWPVLCDELNNVIAVLGCEKCLKNSLEGDIETVDLDYFGRLKLMGFL